MEVSLGMVRRAGRPTPLARKAVEKTWKIGVRSGRRDGFFPAMSPGLGSAASAGGELGEDRGQRHRRSARRAPQAATRLQRGELLAYLLELVADRSELGRDGLLEARNQRVPQLLGIIQREVLSRHGGLTRASFRWPSPPLRFRTGGQSAARPALKRRSMWPLSAPSRECGSRSHETASGLPASERGTHLRLPHRSAATAAWRNTESPRPHPAH